MKKCVDQDIPINEDVYIKSNKLKINKKVISRSILSMLFLLVFNELILSFFVKLKKKMPKIFIYLQMTSITTLIGYIL